MADWLIYCGIAGGLATIFGAGFFCGEAWVGSSPAVSASHRWPSGIPGPIGVYSEFVNQIEAAKTHLSLRNPALAKLNESLCALTLADCDLDNLPAPATGVEKGNNTDQQRKAA